MGLAQKPVGAVSDRDYASPCRNILWKNAKSASETPPTSEFLGKAVRDVNDRTVVGGQIQEKKFERNWN
jgi:hypothetical protein